jgi:hypothetical protein
MGKAELATEKLGIVHSDVCGPLEQTSWSGARYFVTFIGDFIRKTSVYFIETKH